MAKIDITVSVDDAHLSEVSAIAQRLKKAGMKIDEQMEPIGVFVGSIEKLGRRDDLSKIEGVAHVRRSETFQIAPPESPIQ